MAEYRLRYGQSGLSTLYGGVLRGASMSLVGSLLQLSDSSKDYHYIGSDATTLQKGDILAYYLESGANYIPIPACLDDEYLPETAPVGGSVSLLGTAGYLGDYKKNDMVYFLWRTHATPSVNGTIKVYKDNSTDEVTVPTGITDTRDFDSVTNLHIAVIDLSANTFYEHKADYSVVLSGATIDGQTVDAVIAGFSIENRHDLPKFIRDG